MPAMKVTPEQFAQHMTPIDVPERKSIAHIIQHAGAAPHNPGHIQRPLAGLGVRSGRDGPVSEQA